MAANTCRYIRQYADRLDLRNLIPTESISSTEYCIYDPGKQYLVYQPNNSQNFTVNLDKGTYHYEMFNPTTGSIVDSGKITVESGIQNFTYNFYGDAVLFISSVNDPCEGVVCENICLGADLYSQKCVDGFCVTDQLIERNSVNCVSDPCAGVVCSNTCVGDDLWSRRCDPATGQCVLDQLIQSDSINCKIPDVIPSDDSTINTYLILGGLGIVALSVLIASKKEADQS